MWNDIDLSYIDGKFGGYDPVYLDPLICDPGLRAGPIASRLSARRSASPRRLPLLRRLTLWRLTGEERRSRFVRRLLRTVRVEGDAVPGAGFLLDSGAGARFRTDRMLQRTVREVVENNLTELEDRHYPDVRLLLARRPELGKMADWPDATSLIAVDGVLTNLPSTCDEIRFAYQEPPRYVHNSVRGVECLLSDTPGPLLALNSPAIELMFDRNTLYNWNDSLTLVLSAGWYPYARVIGLYATSPGGKPFINVLMLMLREMPSMDALLNTEAGTDARSALPGLLDYKRTTALTPEIQRIEQVRAKEGQPVDNSRPYPRDDEFLMPLHYLAVCCRLNRITQQGLQAQAPAAWQALDRYLEQLTLLGRQLRDLTVQTRIPALDANPGAWLGPQGSLRV